MNRQQNDEPERGAVYEALSEQFRMPEKDVERLEQKLKQRAAALVQAEAEQAHFAETTKSESSKTDDIYAFMRRFQLIPLAACVLLCCGVFWTIKTKFPTAEISAPDSGMTEITAITTSETFTTAQSTTETTAVTKRQSGKVTSKTTSAKQQTTQTTAKTSQTDADTTTAKPTETTSAAATTKKATTQATTTSATSTAQETTTSGVDSNSERTTEKTTSKETTTTTSLTTTETTTASAQTTAESAIPPIRLSAECLSQTVKPGEMVEIAVYADCDVRVAGIQMALCLEPSDPQQIFPINAETEIGDLDSATTNAAFGTYIFAMGTGDVALNHTKLMTMHFMIPEDAPAGTVYTLAFPTGEKCFYLQKDFQLGAIIVEPVKITVTN